MPLKSDPQTMHRLYVTLTGLDIPWSQQRLYSWEPFCLQFTEDDLRVVIAFIKAKAKTRRQGRSLTFRNLIAGPASLEYFAEDLAEAKATRVQRPTAKTALLKATGRYEDTHKTARSAAEILRDEAAFQKFRQCKEEL